jgi:transposase InsO family protein
VNKDCPVRINRKPKKNPSKPHILELAKDRVKHIRSRSHHPMALGKIERFWQSILSEFLQQITYAKGK